MKPVIVALGLVLAGCSQTGQPVTMPPLNPDVTQATIQQTICVRGWTGAIRPTLSFTADLKRQQIPAGASPRDYQEDHIVPLELGGAPMSEGNLRPVPWDRARQDDAQENALRVAVCNGSMTLGDAQAQILKVKEGE